jgi:hypothetical protein
VSASAKDSTSAQPKLVYVAIIGTAGRKEDGPKMSKALLERMVAHATDVQHNTWGLANEQVVLVSGGAAWADHVALLLYQRARSDGRHPYAGLEIFMPCKFISTHSTYRAWDNGWDWKVNPGWLVNKQHDSFSKAVGWTTMDDFKLASSDPLFRLDCSIHGMHARDAAIARAAQRMLAMTWGTGPEPKPGGTLHTWKLCKLQAPFKKHTPLESLNVHSGHTHPQPAVGSKRNSSGLELPQAKAVRTTTDHACGD